MATQSSDRASRPYQAVVFGATGFTGVFVVEKLAQAAADVDFRDSPLRWAVAGRKREKLQEILNKAAEKLGQPQLTLNVGIIICDAGDPASLAEMCKQTSIVVNCVGPFKFYGEPLVKACAENGASCIDITGELGLFEEMESKYESQAADKGVYIIGGCGFESTVADLGVLYTRNCFKGTLTAVESFLKLIAGPEGLCLHDGTWQTAVHGIADQGRLRQLERKTGHKPLPVVGTKLKRRGAVFYSNEVEGYAIPFLGPDGPVVERTQRYLHESLEESPVQYAPYFALGGVVDGIKLMFPGLSLVLFANFNFGRKLMIKHPAFFSFGYFTKEGPSEKQLADSSFEMTFFGEGYSEGQSTGQGKPNMKICTQLKGPEIAYVATSIIMVQAAVTLLKETNSLPKRGGIYTPGAVFSKTTLIERLNRNGIQFSLIRSAEA